MTVEMLRGTCLRNVRRFDLIFFGEGKSNMLILVAVLQVVLLMVGVVLLMRKAAAAPAVDARQAGVPDQLVALAARVDGLDGALRSGLADVRREAGVEAAATRQADATAFSGLRDEVQVSIQRLGETLTNGLADFRRDNKDSAEALRGEVKRQLEDIGQRLERFIRDAKGDQLEAREKLYGKLTELAANNMEHQEKLRGTLGESLDRLSTKNAEKLEEMRVTVDEKLHATLHTRLTESFGQVTDQLNKVHTGLGEMSKLSEGVDGLSRIFTNVKSRGGFAEVQLGMLLKQMLAPGQYIENAVVKPGSLERVEFAVRFPGHAGERLMPIDAKFPREAWERLENAYESNVPDAIAKAGTAFEAAIRTEADRICGKYINQPVTTPYAVMFLPTEGLYAEVIRRDALQAEIQSKCHVTIAGPTTLSAILTSFQMGFHMLALQEKGDEVWKVLERTKTEFKTFETLMGSMEKQVGTVQSTIEKLGVRTRAINRSLRDVSDVDASQPFLLEEMAKVVPMMAAGGEE
jgi:DNA recombination protein RmuC